MGNHAHLRLISSVSIPPHRASIRAPAPHLPPPVSDATCRDLFGTFASMLLLVPVEAGAGKAVELDGELIACCREAQMVNARADAICDGVEGLASSDPRWDAAHAEADVLMADYDAAVARAVTLPARTPEGLRAKAALALSHLQNDDMCPCTEIALSLARDVAGRN